MNRLALRSLILLASLVGWLGAQERAVEVVTTSDGRREVGVVGERGEALLVEGPERHVYLSPSIVAGREPLAEASEEAPVYVFHEDLLDGPKKGRVDDVVADLEWGALGPDGRMTARLVDPRLGRIEVQVVVHRLTPTTYQIRGVDYEWSLEFPIEGLAPVVGQMVWSAVDATDAASLLEAARFFRLSGQTAMARRMLDLARGRAPDDEAVAAEALRQAAGEAAGRLDEFRRLLAAGRLVAAGRLARTLAGTLPPDDQRQLEALEGRLAARDEVVALLAGKGVAFDPTVEQAERLRAILARAAVDGVAVDDGDLPALTAPWVDALAGFPLEAGSIAAALDLAESTAAFFASQKDDGAPALARLYEKSRLPFEVRLAIFGRASAHEAPAGPVGWERIEYRPRSGRNYHYHVQLPSDYRPDVAYPVLIALHGRDQTAEIMNAFFGGVAEAYRFVLISPEYVYGRKNGYNHSEPERLAVIGALRDAARRYHIDPTRVYFTGSSQGGTACWDIGAARAGRFAAVVPIVSGGRNPASFANFLDSAVYVLSGDDDMQNPRFNRPAIERLAAMKVDATYVEYVDRGHESFMEEYPTLFRWLLAHRRERSLAEVHLDPLTRHDTRRQWVDVTRARVSLPDRTTIPRPDVRVRGGWKGNECQLSTRNVTTLDIYLPADLIDRSARVRIHVNDHLAHAGDVEVDWRMALEDAHERGDRAFCYLARIGVRVRE